MADINLTTGILPTTQIPLDSKAYVLTLADLIDLGLDNFKAFIYYDKLVVMCRENQTEYIWRTSGSETPWAEVGIISGGFTYPEGSIVNGIDYSNLTFNFYKITIEPSNVSVPDGLYDGWVTWFQLLQYKNSVLLTVIGGNEYIISQGVLTLDAADATYPRKDTIIAKLQTVGNITTAYITFKKGVPSLNPIAPTVTYGSNELYLTEVLIPKNATVPADAEKVIVYDEKLGGPGEFNLVTTDTGVDLDSEEQSNTNDKSIKIDYSALIASGLITLTPDAPVQMINADALLISVYAGDSIVGNVPQDRDIQSYIEVKLYNAQGQYGATARIQNGQYGFNVFLINTFQDLIIPFAAFNISSYQDSLLTYMTFTCVGAISDTVYLDTIEFNILDNPVAIANTYVALTDTEDDTLVGKEETTPIVLNGKLKLERAVRHTDLHSGNAIIQGGYTHIAGTDQTYYYHANLFIINNVVYNVFVSATKILTAAPAAPNERIDVPVVQVNALTEPASFSIEIVEGDEGVSPVDKPAINLQTQAEFPFKILTSDETVPPEVNTDLVYNENVEWPNILITAGGSLVDTDPFDDTLNVSLPKSSTPQPAQAAWQKASTIAYNGNQNAIFRIKVNGSWSKKGTIQMQLKLAAGVMASIALDYNGITKFGYSHTQTGIYYTIMIPLSALQPWSRSFTVWDTLFFSLENMPDVKLDLIEIQGGLSQPSPNNLKWTDLIDTDNSYTGKAGYKSVVNPTESGMTLVEDTGGGIGGSITNNQIAVGAVTPNEIEGDDNFTYHDATRKLTIANTTILAELDPAQLKMSIGAQSLVVSSSSMTITHSVGYNSRVSPSYFELNDGTYYVRINKSIITEDRNINLPNASGTFALELKGYTVATLPSGTVGDTAYVTDALTPTYLGTAVGGGAVVCKVFYNGTNWIT